MAGIADGVQQVDLAQPNAAIQKQGIVRARGFFGYRLRYGVRQSVVGADNEVIEGVAWIDARKLRRGHEWMVERSS